MERGRALPAAERSIEKFQRGVTSDSSDALRAGHSERPVSSSIGYRVAGEIGARTNARVPTMRRNKSTFTGPRRRDLLMNLPEANSCWCMVHAEPTSCSNCEQKAAKHHCVDARCVTRGGERAHRGNDA